MTAEVYADPAAVQRIVSWAIDQTDCAGDAGGDLYRVARTVVRHRERFAVGSVSWAEWDAALRRVLGWR